MSQVSVARRARSIADRTKAIGENDQAGAKEMKKLPPLHCHAVEVIARLEQLAQSVTFNPALGELNATYEGPRATSVTSLPSWASQP